MPLLLIASRSLIVAFRDESVGGRTSVMKYDGTTWSNMGLAGFTPIASNQSLAVNNDGIPFIAYEDADQAGKGSVKMFMNLVSNVDEVKEQKRLKLFPNPNNGSFIMEYQEGEFWEILSLDGKMMSSGRLSPAFEKGEYSYQVFDRNDLMPGIYFIKVFGKKGVHGMKFIVR